VNNRNIFETKPATNVEVKETSITVRSEERRTKKVLTLNKRRRKHRRSNNDIFKS